LRTSSYPWIQKTETGYTTLFFAKYRSFFAGIIKIGDNITKTMNPKFLLAGETFWEFLSLLYGHQNERYEKQFICYNRIGGFFVCFQRMCRK
jgi:hypothetical protein